MSMFGPGWDRSRTGSYKKNKNQERCFPAHVLCVLKSKETSGHFEHEAARLAAILTDTILIVFNVAVENTPRIPGTHSPEYECADSSGWGGVKCQSGFSVLSCSLEKKKSTRIQTLIFFSLKAPKIALV